MFEQIKRITYTLGSYPQQSLRIFFIGLGAFVSGLALLWHSQEIESWTAKASVIIITLSLIITFVGWIGLFTHRASQIIHRAQIARQRNNHS